MEARGRNGLRGEVGGRRKKGWRMEATENSEIISSV